MKVGWIEKKLSECFRLKSGDSLTSKQMSGGDYPVYGGNGVAGTHDEYNLSGDNVIIGRVGALCGNARHITERIWLTDNAFKIVDYKFDFENDFLTYLLNYKNLRGLARQAAQPVISNTSLKDLILTFPESTEEQKRIVVILDEAFAGIDAAIANTEKNLANARELFESYLNSVFSQQGNGWVKKTLGDVCQFENGDRGKNYPSRSKFVDSGIAFINAGHIDDGIVDLSKMNYITKENYGLLSRGKIKLGDVLFCLRGSLGKFAVINDDIQGAIASSLVIIRPHADLSIEFLLHYLRSGLCKSMIEKYAGGAAQPNLGAKDLAKFSISVPPEEQQKVVSEKLDALMLEVERLDSVYSEKLNSLKELKQSLLQKAFSGELTADPDKEIDKAVA